MIEEHEASRLDGDTEADPAVDGQAAETEQAVEAGQASDTEPASGTEQAETSDSGDDTGQADDAQQVDEVRLSEGPNGGDRAGAGDGYDGPPRTGDPAVDAALAAAAAAQDADPAEQLETYVGTHRSLQDRLADSGA